MRRKACPVSIFLSLLVPDISLVSVVVEQRQLGSTLLSLTSQYGRVSTDVASINKEREALKSAYDGQKWADKVAKMSDAQVHAVFLRLRQQGKI